jgi:O-antigen/teichoic acid export membrane protein
VCAEDITLLMLGSNWIEATVFVQIFGVGAAVRPVIGTSAIVLITRGRSTRYLVITIVHTVVLGLLLVAAIPWGPEGIAIALVGTTLALMYPKLHFSFVDTPVSVSGFFRVLAAPFGSAIVMLCSLLVVRNLAATDNLLVSLALSTGVGGTVYLVSMWLMPGGSDAIRTLLSDMRIALSARQG